MSSYWKMGVYVTKTAKMDYQVKNFCKTLTEKNMVFMNGINELYIHDITKIPLIGRHNKVNTILTVLTDRTKTTDIFHLLKLYMNTQKTPQIGLKYFAQYLGINKFFTEDLTYRPSVTIEPISGQQKSLI